MPEKIRHADFKLYPSAEQSVRLLAWLRTCCWLYNRCLEHRVKAYNRRKESVSLYDQSSLLTKWRGRVERIRLVPAQFARDALRRIDRSMKAFFRRCAAGEKKVGFPRFRSHQRYNSMEQLQSAQFIRERTLFVPGIGRIKARGQFDAAGKQKGIRIIRRASGWYAQVLMQREQPTPIPVALADVCGIDLGLTTFAALDSGDKIGNPRLFRKAAKKLKRAQQRLVRRQKGSGRRKKAKIRVARVHEKIVRQRKGFAHRLSRVLVSRFDGIALENLNVKGLAAGRNAKSVCDAAWSLFVWFVVYKAEEAGKTVVLVDPRGTSQECPQCGAVAAKKLSERIHRCSCGCVLDRDVAAAMVIRRRGFSPARGDSVRPPVLEVAESAKR